jgi:DMSO/TMAO reductase YedYZ molybdopterin-dependent catalytic subunit
MLTPMTAPRAAPPSRSSWLSSDPLNTATPDCALIHPVTPTSALFVRNHFAVPCLDPATWRLAIHPAADHVDCLSITDLGGYRQRDVEVVLECAGNRRSRMRPAPPGLAWGHGALGCVRFTGPALRDVLADRPMTPGTCELLFTGADTGATSNGTGPFARSLPLATARQATTLLATHLNGEPLTAEHGAPLRLVVPGWYGVASVKWLVEIRALTHNFAGTFHTRSYVYRHSSRTADGTTDGPVRSIRVSSLITAPPGPTVIGCGDTVDIRGVAWSDGSTITRVDVSDDNGATWQPARLSKPAGAHAWTPWTYGWRPATTGSYRLLARATDSAGRRQPLRTPWNALGYGNNVASGVDLVVVPRHRTQGRIT